MEAGRRQEFPVGGDGLRTGEQAFGREDDQRLVHVLVHLAAQGMEILRRGGGIDDLHVVIRTELEIPLHPGAGMF